MEGGGGRGGGGGGWGVFFFNDPATTEIYTLSLHDALPIYATNDAWPKSATSRDRTAADPTRALSIGTLGSRVTRLVECRDVAPSDRSGDVHTRHLRFDRLASCAGSCDAHDLPWSNRRHDRCALAPTRRTPTMPADLFVFAVRPRGEHPGRQAPVDPRRRRLWPRSLRHHLVAIAAADNPYGIRMTRSVSVARVMVEWPDTITTRSPVRRPPFSRAS